MKICVRRMIVVLLVMIMVALTGCSKLFNGKYDPDMSIGEQIKTRHYQGHASDFGKNQLLDEILACIVGSLKESMMRFKLFLMIPQA